jgi:hypothetical protein
MTEATLPMAVAGRGDRSRVFSRVASAAVLALALSVLLGWWLDHPGLRSGVVVLIAMNPVTAIGFILASVALWRLLLETAPRGSPGSLGPLIEKPFTVQAILQKVKEALSGERIDA